MDINEFYTYVLITYLKVNSKDIFDIFLPLILKVLELNPNCSSFKLKSEYNNSWGIDIPQYVVDTILIKAKKKGYVITKGIKINHLFTLTDEGKSILPTQNNKDEKHREIEEVIFNFKTYMNRHAGKKYDTNKTINLLKWIIHDYLLRDISFSLEKININNASSEFTKMDKKNFLSYVDKIKGSKYHSVLNDIIYGFFISISLFASEEIIKNTSEKFIDTKIFLDTNFIISLLELNPKHQYMPVKELFNLMQTFPFTFYYLDITEFEIYYLLNQYKISFYQNANTEFSKNSLFATFKRLGLTPRNIDNKFKEYFNKLNTELK